MRLSLAIRAGLVLAGAVLVMGGAASRVGRHGLHVADSLIGLGVILIVFGMVGRLPTRRRGVRADESFGADDLHDQMRERFGR